jgi:hypothetical protein
LLLIITKSKYCLNYYFNFLDDFKNYLKINLNTNHIIYK